MLSSTIGSLSDRLDTKFLTAYWLPAFVAVLGGFGILAALVGPQQLDAWVYDLDSVEQSLGALIILLLMTMLAFVLRALSRPIAEVFAGDALPRAVADWSTRGQLRAKRETAQVLGVASDGLKAVSADQQATQRLAQLFPQDDADAKPTLFGNVLATAAEHPRFAYAMVGTVWWPRLSPLLPASFQDLLSSAQAPMMGLLNLSVVFAALGLVGGAILALAGATWLTAIVVLVGGLLLSRLCYRAAVSQAAELGSILRVAFDLYRHEILRQMDLEVPSDLAAERALWPQLTGQLLGLRDPTITPSDTPDAASDSPQHP